MKDGKVPNPNNIHPITGNLIPVLTCSDPEKVRGESGDVSPDSPRFHLLF